MMGFGKSLELFFVNGKPDEMLTARVFNWTGHVLKAPRTQIKDALDRPEAQFTGTYLLIGEVDGVQMAYIGEGECIADRIKQHDLKKDWWDQAVFITTTANELNKAHVKYLESRLISLAGKSKVAKLDNGTQPLLPKLSEASVSNMEEFLDVLMVVLPAIGVSIFVDRAIKLLKESVTTESQGPLFVLSNKKHKITARARLVDGSFVVLKGSQARQSWEGKYAKPTTYETLHGKLVIDNVLDTETEPAQFTTDYAFESPSAAAAVCQGRSANGRLDWISEGTGLTYSSWEAQRLGAVAT